MEIKVIINNHNISPEDNLKYLGVLLDNKLSWKPHVQKVKTQLSRACGILCKLEHYTTPVSARLGGQGAQGPHQKPPPPC